MTRIYRNGLNRVFEIDQFNKEEQKHLTYLLDEYNKADSYEAFEDDVEDKTLEVIKHNIPHPLWSIYLDLAVNVGIRNNEYDGKLSDMVIEKTSNMKHK